MGYQEKRDKILQHLASKNHRITKVRKAIVEILCRNDHITLNFIKHELVKKVGQSINLASIYNTLSLLIKEHLISTVTFDNQQILYECLDEITVHYLCDNCNLRKHLNQEQLEQYRVIYAKICSNMIKNDKWSFPEHVKIEIHAICQNCHNEKN